VRAGDNRRTIVLYIAKVDEQVDVERDRQSAALDPQGAAFSTVLTREQIDALPDDPDEMEAALKAMAPPGAPSVDGFSGGKLPPKSQIRSIRMPRMDMMAAQNHGGLGGAMHIDIMTQPGQGPLRGGIDFTFRDDALNARNPFAVQKGDERLQRYGATFAGTIRPNRSSFSLHRAEDGAARHRQPAGSGARQHARGTGAAADGTLAIHGRFDQAINKDHALRIGFNRTGTERRNQGIGGFDLPERAFERDERHRSAGLRERTARTPFLHGVAPAGALVGHREQLRHRGTDDPRARFFHEWRRAAGGRQHSVQFEAASDLDYVRGRHSMRVGMLVEGGRYHSDSSSNYLGTWTFSSMADYLAGRPMNYSRRIGDPEVRYSNVRWDCTCRTMCGWRGA
jgi:hypothetical protein